MMEGWEKYTFSQVTSLITKGTTPSTYGFDFEPEGEVNFIRAEGISKDGYIDESTFLKISFACDEKLKRSKIKEDDILFSIAGMALGKSGIVRKDFLPANTNQAVAILRPNSLIHPKFLLYYIVNPSFYKLVNSVSGQAAQPNINLAQIGLLPINLPSLPTQRKIASILAAYDDLIENNLKRIKLLEEKAQLTYEEWFVRMKFPGHEKVKIDKETGLPEGWEKKKIGDVIEVGRGSSPRPIADQKYFVDGDIPWLKIADATASNIFIYKTKQYVNDYGASFSRKLPTGSIVVAASGTLGFPMILGVEACIHDGWLYFKGIEDTLKEYFYFSFIGLRKYFEAISYGAAIQNINTGIVRQSPFIIPDENTSIKFKKLASAIFESINGIQKQNQLLKEARDILLPRLMSGMIDVEELDVKLEE